MRHVIAHDGIPVFALVLKSSGFSLKARYVNDVHLPRFDRLHHLTFCNRRSDLVLQLLLGFTTRFYTEQPPAARCTTGIQRISPPRTLGMIAKRRFCVNRRSRDAQSVSAPLHSSPRAFLAQDLRHSAKPPSLALLVQG